MVDLFGIVEQRCAFHALGVVGHRDFSIVRDGDYAGVAAEAFHFVQHFRDRIRQANAGPVTESDGRSAARADDVLARTRAGNRDIVVGPGAGADQRRVADTAVQFAERAAGRRGGGQATIFVERHRTDGTVRNILDIVAPDADRQDVVPSRIRHFLEAMLASELERAASREHDVRRLLHHAARDAHRADPPPVTYRP